MNAVAKVAFGVVFLVAQVAMASEIRVWPRSQESMVSMPAEAEGVQDGPVIFGPAPNLSSVKVIAVCSANFYQVYYPYDCQDVRGLYSTGFDHGGAWMEVITEDMGYSSWRSATMNTFTLSEIYTQYIVNSYNEVIGFRRWWQANGHQSGQFSYTAQSINTGPRLSTWISIQ